MKEIKLLKLTLEQFKGCAKLTLDFGGLDAAVYGDNGAGKSTIYDALCWLLFGKDSSGSSSFEIKPKNLDGSVRDHAAISAVEAQFLDGLEPVCLRRTYYEKWTCKRGSQTESFDGHSSDFFVDGVPCTKTAFGEAVSALVPEDVFRLLTDVSYFCAGLAWQQRREVLFEVCGTRSDAEIMAGDARFVPLAEACGKLTVDALRKKLQAERKGYTGLRNDVPVRLDECQKSLQELQGIDFAGLRKERDSCAKRLETEQAALVQLDNDSLLQRKQNERDALRNELRALEQANEAFRAKQVLSWHDPRPELTRQAEMLHEQIARFQADSARFATEQEESEREIARCRIAWKESKALSFSGGRCPTCGQTLSGVALQEAEEAFGVRKEKDLAAIVAESERHKQRIQVAAARIANVEKECASLAARLEETQQALAAVVPPEAATVLDQPNYAAQRADWERRCFEVEEELARLKGQQRSLREEKTAAIAAHTLSLRQLDERLAAEGVLRFTQERMEALRDEAQRAAEKIEALDALLFLCEDFVCFQTRCVEESVNSRFHLAKFKLFAEQVNGGLSDCCEATFDGVPYNGGLNDAAKVNLGMDVIETLSEHYGVRVPLFVDGAESVTRLYAGSMQIIRLIVSEADKTLRLVTAEEKVWRCAG